MSTDTFPVVIGTCLDAEAIWFNKIGENEHRPVMLSNGAYAIREGLEPLLDLFDAHGIRSTFFVPGVTAERYPDAVKQIQDRGHELASHTYSHMSAVVKEIRCVGEMPLHGQLHHGQRFSVAHMAIGPTGVMEVGGYGDP